MSLWTWRKVRQWTLSVLSWGVHLSWLLNLDISQDLNPRHVELAKLHCLKTALRAYIDSAMMQNCRRIFRRQYPRNRLWPIFFITYIFGSSLQDEEFECVYDPPFKIWTFLIWLYGLRRVKISCISKEHTSTILEKVFLFLFMPETHLNTSGSYLYWV